MRALLTGGVVYEKIEEWICQVNASYENMRRPCTVFQKHFNDFYSHSFLETAYFVVVDKIPKPDFPELREAGLGAFIDMDAKGITYDDTYYVTKRAAHELRLHFHELVHVIQWQELTPQGFIARYIQEMQTYGYDDAPLERMAYALDAHYQASGQKFSVEQFVRKSL
ncbi:hypothetical protein BFR47_06050 [Oceanisphaera psychrotolerans]|uniref:DUF4157 domain-containing protein n=1 Tax=Oceanisphaera psychrotolerans TaxID=1414654 RepID=A0A1J4QA49_9GAMM|nr:hypothetical protein BFR47_06050 [Oceanisphaera psychrotolerans]